MTVQRDSRTGEIKETKREEEEKKKREKDHPTKNISYYKHHLEQVTIHGTRGSDYRGRECKLWMDEWMERWVSRARSTGWRLVERVDRLVELLELLHPHPLAFAHKLQQSVPGDAEQERVFSVKSWLQWATRLGYFSFHGQRGFTSISLFTSRAFSLLFSLYASRTSLYSFSFGVFFFSIWPK